MADLEGTTLGRYQIISRLGQGGMSVVYLGYDENMHRNVAIKVVGNSYVEYIERFRREAEAIGRLSHDHILPAFDYGEQSPWHFLVMPYIEDGTLRNLIDEGPLSLDYAGEILVQIASALQFAHDQGIIHRDLKPSNILLRDDHYIYLADFGLAKELDSNNVKELTLAGTLLGTPEYMAPELSHGPATTSSDIYALGILLYQMLTGEAPFTGDTPLSVYWKQVQELPPPPTTLNPDIPIAVERVILRALEKDPRDRFQTPEDLSGAYLRALTMPDADIMDNLPTGVDSEELEDLPVPHPHRPVVNYDEPLYQEEGLILSGDPVVAPTAVAYDESAFALSAPRRSRLSRIRASIPAMPPLKTISRSIRPVRRRSSLVSADGAIDTALSVDPDMPEPTPLSIPEATTPRKGRTLIRRRRASSSHPSRPSASYGLNSGGRTLIALWIMLILIVGVALIILAFYYLGGGHLL